MQLRRYRIGVGLALVVALGPMAVSAQDAQPLSPESLAALEQIKSDDDYTRRVGFLRLEAIREPAAADAIRHYAGGTDPDLRAESLRALAAIEGARTIPMLLEQLKTRRWPRVRWSALLALEPFYETHPELLEPFIGAMRDYRSEVRMTAIDIVSRIDDPAAREAIRTRFKKERHSDVRHVLRAAMKRIGAEE